MLNINLHFAVKSKVTIRVFNFISNYNC